MEKTQDLAELARAFADAKADLAAKAKVANDAQIAQRKAANAVGVAEKALLDARAKEAGRAGA